jgi:hypothetical protein
MCLRNRNDSQSGFAHVYWHTAPTETALVLLRGMRRSRNDSQTVALHWEVLRWLPTDEGWPKGRFAPVLSDTLL